MKKFLKIVLPVLVVAILACGGAYWYFNSGDYIASSPENIAKEAGWKLPDHKVISHNEGDGQSDMKSHEWVVELNKPLSEKKIKKLRKLAKKKKKWTSDEADDVYTCLKEKDNSKVFLTVKVKENKVYLTYSWK